MRVTSAVLVLVLTSAAALRALPISEGKIVQGRYEANGKSSTAGVSVTYRSTNVRITNHGRVMGRAVRRVTSRGTVVENSLVKVRGKVRTLKVRARKNTFEAPAVVRVGKGAAFRGQFSGLADRSQRLSRFFHGKLNGNKNSNLTLRSR